MAAAEEKNFYVAIDRDGQGAAWMCFRANNCGCKGGGRLKGAPERPAPQIRHYRRPTLPVKREVTSGLVDVFMQFKISLATMDALGIYRTERRMPVIGRDGKQVGGDVREKRPVIAYPYYVDGELVNVKYKAIYRRGDRVIKRFAQEFNAEPWLFNIDNFETDEWGIIVEGEDVVLPAMRPVGSRPPPWSMARRPSCRRTWIAIPMRTNDTWPYTASRASIG